MTVADCAAFLAVDKWVIMTAVRDQRLSAYRFGRRALRIRRSEFLRYIESCKA